MSGWGYFKQASTAEIERSARKALDAARKKGQVYHPVTIIGNKIARTWWGMSWCENLERYADYANRLPRGRRYVRHGAVVDLALGKGAVHAKVQGSSLYQIDIRFDPLRPEVEKELGEVCAQQIQNVEELVSGKFPENLKERFLARGGLFPSPREIHFKCSCPDWAGMCKHVAAVMYGIGARLDSEPLGFFDLRGIRTEDFVARAVENKVESMLSHAARQSSRIIGDDQLEALFGMGLGNAMEAPGHRKTEVKTPFVEQSETAASKRRGRPPKTAVQAEQPTETKRRGRPPKAAVQAEQPAEPKRRGRPPKNAGIPAGADRAQSLIRQSNYPEKMKENLIQLADSLQGEVFGNSRVCEILKCSAPTATAYLRKLHEELGLIVPAAGQGKGKYRFG